MDYVRHLEYRLIKEENKEFESTPIFYYENIELEQILARRECEFFIKEGVTYKQTASEIYIDLCIIYVIEFERGEKDLPKLNDYLYLEVRKLDETTSCNHTLITELKLSYHIEVLAYIGAVYSNFNDKEWIRDSAEMDEDRKRYVLYVKPL